MMTIKFILFVCSSVLWSNVSARCAFRGSCIEILGNSKPCVFDDEAPYLLEGLSAEDRAEIINLVETRCPHLLYDEDGNLKALDDIKTCCDSGQLKSMSNSLMLSDGILGRCPTCIRNFARQICEMNCSPDQARFLNVTTETQNDIVYVNEINYRMYEDFMINAHKSCSGVIVPQSGMPAINLMCGAAAVDVCDAESWFGSTGDAANNPLVPIQVNFFKSPTKEDSMNVYAPLCHETGEGDIPCSCIDCLENCPVGNEPLLPEMCTVLSVNCVAFSVAIVFFVTSVIIFIILALLEYRRCRNNDLENNDRKYQYQVNKLDQLFQYIFGKIGAYSANNPVLMIMLTTWVTFGMLYGVTMLHLTAKPIDLWSAPESRSRQDFNYFNSRFGPFYRAAQVFLTFDLEPFVADNTTFGPAYRLEAIEELIRLEDAIMKIGQDEGTVRLENICYAPLRTPGSEESIEHCVSMSISTYLPDRYNINNETYLRNIQTCLNNYFAMECLATWGGGADPEISVGGFEEGNMLSANTLLINLPIANHLNEENLAPVLEWESRFIELLHDYEQNHKSDYVTVAFGAERSIEDEIQRISVAEAVPITISYLLMFIYVIFSLGNVRRLKTCFVDSKATVALCSIIIVLLSILCAMGVLGYIGTIVTLLAINVIPFFVLSVGIDNVFLMVNALKEVEDNLSDYKDYRVDFNFEEKRYFVFEKMMRKVGPSMFMSSITQITCVSFGSLANFPAVQTFAVFAAWSLAFLFVFQITTAVAIISIDYKRASQNRFDIFCCIQKKILNDEEPLQDGIPSQSMTRRLMGPYSKFILNWRVKIAVTIIFLFLVSFSTVLIPQLEVGLDQEMALPTDSYVYKYLQAVNNLLYIGPPVYFVLKSGLNFTDINHQNAVCGGQLCNEDSLATQIFLASRYSNVTYIARTSNSWLDDFFDWASLPGSCCKYNTTDGSFCSSTDLSAECSYCSIDRSEYANGLRPGSDAFNNYIPFFLRDEPTDTCSKGGLASYFSNVIYVLDSEGHATVQDSNFMAYHSTLVTSKDYISAVKYGYEISANISVAIKKNTGVDVEVFPYSVFYVFFEQYLTMWSDTFLLLGLCLIVALVVNLLITGFNILVTSALMITVVMIVVDMMGVMYIWNIPLNAVSCMNLVVSIGIGVEFCSHMAYAYSTSEQPPDKKVADAIKAVGGTVITGITFTNIPVIVLAFSYTEIIEVFFFRMFFSIVIISFLHGMIFFPVLLSYFNNLKYKI